MNYHYANENNQPVGPLPAEYLHNLYQSGEITLDTFIFEEGAKEWQPYHTLTPANIFLGRPTVKLQEVEGTAFEPFYYSQHGDVFGPFDLDELINLGAIGAIGLDAFHSHPTGMTR